MNCIKSNLYYNLLCQIFILQSYIRNYKYVHRNLYNCLYYCIIKFEFEKKINTSLSKLDD